MNTFENVIFAKEKYRQKQNPNTIIDISDISQNSKFLKHINSPNLLCDYQNYNNSLSSIKYHRSTEQESKSIEKIVPQNKFENLENITSINNSKLPSKNKDNLSSISPEIQKLKRNNYSCINNYQVTSTFDLNIKDVDLISDNENDNEQLYEFKKQLLEKEEEKNDNETIEKLKALRAKYLPGSLEKDPSIVETNLNFNNTCTNFYNKDQNSLCISSHGKTPIKSFSKTFANCTRYNFRNNISTNDFSGDNKSSSNCFKSNYNFRSFYDKVMNDDNNLKNNNFVLKEKDNKIKKLMEENEKLNNELKELDIKYKDLYEEYIKLKSGSDSENKETLKKLKQENDYYKEYLKKENKELNIKNKKYDLIVMPLIEYINEINNLLGFRKINILSIKQTIKNGKDTKIDNPFIGIITFLKYCGNKAHEIFDKEKTLKSSNKVKSEIGNHKKRSTSSTSSHREMKKNFDFKSFVTKPKISDKYNVAVIKNKSLKKGMKSNNEKIGNVKNVSCNVSAKKNSKEKKKKVEEEMELGYWRGNTYVKVKI